MNRQYTAVSGIAIALIVLNHTVHFTLQISPVSGYWLRAAVFLQAFGVFAVPAFLFVSGAFLSYAARQMSFTFLRNSIGRIFWPYAIWTAVFFVLVLPAADALPSPAAYFRYILTGYPYHFVPLLLFWYLSSPIVIKIASRLAIAAAMLVAIGGYQALLLVLRFPDVFSAAGAIPSWLQAARLPVLSAPLSDWAIYFPLGLVLSLHASKVKGLLHRAAALFVLAAGVLTVLGLLNAFGLAKAEWTRFVGPLPVMFVLPIVERSSIPFLGAFEFLGRRSYGIYLVHFVVLSLAAVLAARAHLAGLPMVVVTVLFVLGFGLPLLLMRAMTKTDTGRRLYRFVFGTVPPSDGARQGVRSVASPARA